MRRDVEPLLITQVLALASTQLGLFSVRQARQLGISNSAIDRAVARGWIRRERYGVYAIAGLPPSRWRPTYAAALAAGPDAIISHGSAAAVHSFYGVIDRQIELTVPWPMVRQLAGVRTHRSKTLLPGDIDRRHGLLVTSPIRTLLDLAPRFRDPLLGSIVDEGAISRLWTPEQVEARIALFRAHPAGLAELRRLLALRTDECHPDSRLEQRVIRVVKPLFPGYALQHPVTLDGHVFLLDIAWPAQKIDGEVEGMTTRAKSLSKFDHTLQRENILTRHGWRVVHFTAAMDDATIVAQLAPYFR